MTTLKDSVTKANLLRAFAGECQAWRRYELAASRAKRQNLDVLYWLFRYTGQERPFAAFTTRLPAGIGGTHSDL